MGHDNSLIASSRRDGISYVSKIIRKTRSRREWVGSALKGTSEGPLWEMISPLLALDDVVKLRTAATEWNKGSKYGSCDESFFFLVQNDPH